MVCPDRPCRSPAALKAPAVMASWFPRCSCSRSQDASQEFGLLVELPCHQLSREDQWISIVITDCSRVLALFMSEISFISFQTQNTTCSHKNSSAPPTPKLPNIIDQSSLVKLHNNTFQWEGKSFHVVHDRINLCPAVLVSQGR